MSPGSSAVKSTSAVVWRADRVVDHSRRRLVADLGDFEAVPMQVNRMLVAAAVVENQAVSFCPSRSVARLLHITPKVRQTGRGVFVGMGRPEPWITAPLGNLSFDLLERRCIFTRMVRIAISTVEVTSPNGTKTLWVAALPHNEAVAAVRRYFSPVHVVELSILRSSQRSPKVKGIRPGEVRKIETLTVSSYQANAVGPGGHFVESQEMVCRDDREAVAEAKRLIRDRDVEVWNGDRFVIRLVKRLK